MNPLTRVVQNLQRRFLSYWTDKLEWGSAFLPLGLTTGSGTQVTPLTALSLTAAYCAINAISTDIASLPLEVYRRRKDGSRDSQPDHPVAVLFRDSPDGETTSMRWRQAAMGHVLGWGNGYAEVTFRKGEPTGLYILDPRQTEPARRPQDQRLYYQSGSDQIPTYRVLHFAGLGFDGLKGYSPVKLAKEAIGLGLATERFGATFFGNATQPRGVLKTPQKMTPDGMTRLRSDWEALHRGPENAHRIAVLEQGMEWQSITIPPEDAQFLETRKFQVSEIARLYRIPPHKLGDYSQMQLASAGVEAANLDYMTTTLMPWCEAMEQEINRKLFTREERDAGFFVEHKMAAFLRGDMASRADYYTKLRDLGVFSPNDIRRLENLNPIPDGDVYLVPMNMQTLEQAAQEPEPAPAALAPGQPAPEEEGQAEDEGEDPAEEETPADA